MATIDINVVILLILFCNAYDYDDINDITMTNDRGMKNDQWPMVLMMTTSNNDTNMCMTAWYYYYL